MCSIANIVIINQYDVIMKYMEKILEISTSLMDHSIATAPVSAPASTAAKNTFVSIVKTTQRIIMKPSVSVAVVASKDYMKSKSYESLKKVNVRNATVTNKGTLAVDVFSGNHRKSAVSRLNEGFSSFFVVGGAKMLLPKFTVVGIPSDLPKNEIISAFCEK